MTLKYWRNDHGVGPRAACAKDGGKGMRGHRYEESRPSRLEPKYAVSHPFRQMDARLSPHPHGVGPDQQGEVALAGNPAKLLRNLA